MSKRIIKVSRKKKQTPISLTKYKYPGQIEYNIESMGITDMEMPLEPRDVEGLKQYIEQKIKQTLENYYFKNLETKPYTDIPEKNLGILFIDNLGNDKNIYFKHYTPYSTLFQNIVAQIKDRSLLVKNVQSDKSFDAILQNFTEWLNTQKSLTLGIDKITELLTKRIDRVGDTKGQLQDILYVSKLVSMFLGDYSIIFVQDSIDLHTNLFSYDTAKNINNNIILLYISDNSREKKYFIFNPIIRINLDIEKKFDFVINNKDEISFLKSKIDDIMTSPPIKVVDTARTIHTKVTTPKVEDEHEKNIIFNPNDKNCELPVIDIHLDTGTKRFLLGNEYNGFYNIYYDDNKDNNIAGKISFNQDRQNKIITVYWC